MTTSSLNTEMPVYQIVTSTINTVVTCTTLLPRDDTIPQKTEGDEVLTATIVPRSATSKLLIEFFAPFALSAVTTASEVALFQDATAGALSAHSFRHTNVAFLSHFMTSGTASSTTFKIRMGPEGTPKSVYVNGDTAGNRVLGGVSLATLKITEFLIE